jgi:hypothetical protein
MLKLKLKSLEGLDDGVKALYKEVGGEFILDVEGGVPDVDGLKTALNKERDRVKELENTVKTAEGQLKKFGGLDPDKVQELVNLEADIKDKGKGWERMREQLNSTHAEAISEKEKRIQFLNSVVEEQMIANVASMEIEKAGGSPLLLLPHVRKEAKLVEENGKFHVRLFNDKGDPIIDNQGQFLTIGGRVNQMRGEEGFGGAFKSSGASGGGVPPNSGGGPKGSFNNLDRSKMTIPEKDAFIAEHGYDKYMALPMTLASSRSAAGGNPIK